MIVPLHAHGEIKRSSSSTSVNLDMLPALLLAIGDDSRQIRHVSSRCPVCGASDMFSKLRIRGVVPLVKNAVALEPLIEEN